jgi:catechol 2,3-dioxygenase-like lactoylglutathione lyase family enzyme
MAALAYQQDAGYKDKVAAIVSNKTNYPLVIAELGAPAAQCVRYHHLGLACRDVAASVVFYGKLGFSRLPGGDVAASRGANIVRLRGAGAGLELHLVQADDLSTEGNLLMDYEQLKPPGHTHASWKVPSVPSVKLFLASLDMALSGTRSTLAVFVRDPDRTTLEFERNDGGDEPPPVFGGEHVGYGCPLDHVGIRTRAPHDRHLEWAARNLGFNLCVSRYDVAPDPLKNGRPMITRAAHAGETCDINWIPNCNTVPPAPAQGGEGAEAPLFAAGGRTKPGILYAAFSIVETDARAVLDRLRANGADAVLDCDVSRAPAWAAFPTGAVRVVQDHPTVLLRDLNGTVLRLVPAPARL